MAAVSISQKVARFPRQPLLALLYLPQWCSRLRAHRGPGCLSRPKAILRVWQADVVLEEIRTGDARVRAILAPESTGNRAGGSGLA